MTGKLVHNGAFVYAEHACDIYGLAHTGRVAVMGVTFIEQKNA